MARSSLMTVTALTLLVLGAFTSTTLSQDSAARRRPTTMTADEFDKLFNENRNWGRWGKDDTRGTINLITEVKRRQAAAAVKNGISVTVAHPLSTEQTVDNPRPLVQVMGPTFRTDTYAFSYHGCFITHLDALCHYLYKETMYNGRPPSVSSAQGCFPGVENFRDGIVTRGILIDIPRLKGMAYLEPGTAIFPEEVEAWERKAGVKVSAGDAVLLHTGRWGRREKVGAWAALGNASGFDITMGSWIRSRDVAIAGGDVSVEVQTAQPYVEGQPFPLHTLFIAGLGIPILDNLDTEKLAETAAKLNRWEFLFMVAPLPVPGGTGSPVNPIAVF